MKGSLDFFRAGPGSDFFSQDRGHSGPGSFRTGVRLFSYFSFRTGVRLFSYFCLLRPRTGVRLFSYFSFRTGVRLFSYFCLLRTGVRLFRTGVRLFSFQDRGQTFFFSGPGSFGPGSDFFLIFVSSSSFQDRGHIQDRGQTFFLFLSPRRLSRRGQTFFLFLSPRRLGPGFRRPALAFLTIHSRTGVRLFFLFLSPRRLGPGFRRPALAFLTIQAARPRRRGRGGGLHLHLPHDRSQFTRAAGESPPGAGPGSGQDRGQTFFLFLSPRRLGPGFRRSALAFLTIQAARPRRRGRGGGLHLHLPRDRSQFMRQPGRVLQAGLQTPRRVRYAGDAREPQPVQPVPGAAPP